MASDYESLLDKSAAKHFVLKDSKMNGDSPTFSSADQGGLVEHLRQTKEHLNATKQLNTQSSKRFGQSSGFECMDRNKNATRVKKDVWGKKQSERLCMGGTKTSKDYISRLTRKHGIAKWRAHTAFTHPMKQLPKILAGDLPPNSICTQAYCKFAEILLAYPQLSNPGVYNLDRKDNSGKKPIKKVVEFLQEAGFECLRLKDLFKLSSTKPIYFLVNVNVLSSSVQVSALCSEALRSEQRAGANGKFEKSEAKSGAGPGGFVSCLRNTVDKSPNWDWRMNSLNPHHEYNKPSEMLCDDTLIVECPHKMMFGEDDTGNILSWTDGFVRNLRCKWNFRLDNPISQELTVAPLIAQEVKIALGCLQTGGNLVLKMFTFFEFVTHNILAQLLANFECVEVCKPASSKPGNSEVYVVCLNFESNCSSSPLPPLSNSQLQRIADCATYFASHQIKWISFNLRTFNNLSANERQNMDIRKCLQIETLKSRILCETAGSSKKEAMHQNETNPWLKHWNSSKYKSGQIWPSDNCFQTFTSGQEPQAAFSKAVVNMCREAENLHDSLMNINGLAKPPFFVVQRAARNSELQQSITHSLFCSISLLGHNYEVYSQDQVPNCSYSAKRPRLDRIEQKRQSVVLNIQPNTLILSRFAASVTFLLMLKFDRIYLRDTQIAFDGERHISDSQTSCISTLLECIKSTDEHEVLQFVPLKCFANPDFYYILVTYNNTKLSNLKINDMP